MTRVLPERVAEVFADTACTGGVFRQALRFVRMLPDLTPDGAPVLA